ncbi:MAG: hypothetical protein LQ339_003149 [Xanthoria mediterranea]|nr:MAG: hypothetical protein LQ339_003149 [Xanthoria mediterranea]
MTSYMIKAKAHLKEQCWVKIPSILTKDDDAQTRDLLWKAKETSEASGEETFQPILDHNPLNVRVFYLPELDKVLRGMLTHHQCMEMTKSVLGSRSIALRSHQSIVLSEP